MVYGIGWVVSLSILLDNISEMYMGSWRINVSYGVTAKMYIKKPSNIEDKPLSCYL